MLKRSFFSIYRYLTIGLALCPLYSTESFAQNGDPTFSDPEWRVIAQYFDDSGNRAYYAETPGQLPLFSTAEAACEAGAEYVLPRLGASSDNLSPGYQQGMAYSDTRPFGDIEYILNGVVYYSTKGRKCSIDGWERGGSGVTSYDIFENSQRITTVETLQSPNGGVSYLYKKVWIGSISAIPDCSNTGSLYIIDGAPTCVSGGYSQYRNSPDCEGAEGDSPKSTPPKKCAGNPIAIDSGAKQHQDTDYSTADGLMSVKRKYRSNSRPGNLSETITEIPGFGLNWRGLLPGRITLKQGYSWTAEFLNDEGGVRRFSINDNGSGDFTIEATGVPTRLTLAFTQPLSGSIDEFVSGATSSIGNGDLRMAYANGDYIVFRRAGDFDQQGRMRNFVPIEHGLATGYKRWFEYPDTGQYPNKIRDSLGREMTIDWTEIGWASSSLRGYYKSPNQSTIPAGMTLEKAVSAIMLPDGTRLAYGYGASSASGFLGNLETAKRLDASNDMLWGRTYLYEDIRFKSAMTGILDQNGARLSTYSYNETGQAASTQRAGGFDHQQVSYSVGPESPENYYQPVDTRDVTNALGLITRYTYSAYSENYSGGESPGPDPRKTPRRLLNMQGQATLSLPERTQTYEYDEDGLNVARTGANGQRTSQENILGEGRPAQVTDATGVSTQIEWHPIFDLPVREARKNLRTDYGYSDQGQLINVTQTDTEGGVSRTTEISYGEAGRILSVNGPRAPDAEGRDDVTTMTYDTQGNRLTMTNPLGHLTSYGGYDANGRPSRMIDANGIATEFTYDALGRVKTTNIKHPTDPTKHAVTEMDYDVEGRVTATTGPDTTTLRFEYNLAGLMTAIRSDDGERIDYTHDPMGNVLSETVMRADGTQARGVVRTFDELSRLLTLTLGPDRTTRFLYDKVGNPTKITSARGNAVEQAFDPLNRLVTTLAPDGGKTGYGFAGGTLAATGGGTVEESVSSGDGNGPASELGAFRDPNGVTTRFTRNAFGEVSEEVSPDRGTIRYEYDNAGDLSAMVDGRGQRVEFTRDILGRVVSKTPIGRPQSERVTYTYDAPIISGSYTVGRLSQIDDGSGATRFGYDHRGNLVTRIQKLAGTPDWVALRFTYDLADRIETIIYPSGRQVRYVRDTKGRVVAVRTRANNSVVAWTNVATGMSYEAFGALKTMNLGNGERSVAAYGDDGRVVARRLSKVADGSNISHQTYGYDADDNMVRITDHVDASRTQNFAYDKAGRLTRVTAASGDMRRTDYVFDGNGNRTRVLTRPLPEDPASAASIDRYALQAGTNQLKGITGPSGTRSFSYDARGNMLTEARPGGVTVSAGYDGHGRLTSYARNGEASLSHVYNGLDDRVATTTGSDTRRFVYAPDGRVLGEYGTNASDVKAEYIWMQPEVGEASTSLFGGDDGLGGYMPLAVAANDNQGISQLTWVHANHMGVPIRYSDRSGNTLNPPTDYSVPGFPGQSRTLSDLYYNRYRDYDSSTGRYIQADPIGLAGGAEPYGYALNNPLRYTDPTGEFGVVGAIIGGGIDLGIQLLANGGEIRCVNWASVGVSAAAGAITGGIGGAGFRATAGLSTKFSNVSRKIRNAENLVGSGKDLHHWLLPRRWESAFGGRAARVVNGRWNLNPVGSLAHRELHRSNLLSRTLNGSPDWARQVAGTGAVSIAGGIAGDIADDDCGCSR